MNRVYNKAFAKPLFAAMFPWMGTDYTGALGGDRAARGMRVASHRFWEMQMPLPLFLGHRVRDAKANPRAPSPDTGPVLVDAEAVATAALAPEGPRRQGV